MHNSIISIFPILSLVHFLYAAQITRNGCDVLVNQNTIYTLSNLDHHQSTIVLFNRQLFRFYFNPCQNTQLCNQKGSYAVLVKLQPDSLDREIESDCYRLTYDSEDDIQIQEYQSQINNRDELHFNFTNGDICSFDMSHDFGFSESFICVDSDIESYNILIEGCTFYLNYFTKNACPQKLESQFFTLMKKYFYLFGPLLIILGIVILVLPLKLIKFSLLIYTAMFMTAISLFLLFFFIIPQYMEEYQIWLVLILAVSIGCILSGICLFVPQLSVLFMGSSLGFIITLLLYNLFLFYISDSYLMLWVTLGILCVIGAIVSYFFYAHWMIVCNSICGFYLIARGISCFLKFQYFPCEFTLSIEIQNGDRSSTQSPWFYVYFAAIMVCSLVAIVLAEKRKAQETMTEVANRKKYVKLIDIIEDREKLL